MMKTKTLHLFAIGRIRPDGSMYDSGLTIFAKSAKVADWVLRYSGLKAQGFQAFKVFSSIDGDCPPDPQYDN